LEKKLIQLSKQLSLNVPFSLITFFHILINQVHFIITTQATGHFEIGEIDDLSCSIYFSHIRAHYEIESYSTRTMSPIAQRQGVLTAS